MNRFAALLDRLAYEPRRTAKLRLLVDYFTTTPDPDRGFALAAMTGTLELASARPAMLRDLVAARTDPVLFALSYDFVGDLSETVALMWPTDPLGGSSGSLSLGETVQILQSTKRADMPSRIASMLDGLDETGRWALLKLVTGGLRIGVSARLAKTALAQIGVCELAAIDEVWHGLSPPFEPIFAWIEGRGPRPVQTDPAPFRPIMLANALDETDLDVLDPVDFRAEWKWDGIRVQAVGGVRADGSSVVRLYARSGDNISGAFPDLIAALQGLYGTIDGELLVIRDGVVGSFNDVQQRLNRKKPSARLISDFPAVIRAYDILFEGGDDLRGLPFLERRARLEEFVRRMGFARLDLSPLLAFETWQHLDRWRMAPGDAGHVTNSDAIEGCMIKRHDSLYVGGRPKGLWFKWKRSPYLIDAVLMYAQRGHGKRSSLYSDFTFGVWRMIDGHEELVPVGKAYFGFTDQELAEIDRFVRKNTVNRFGPVREVVHDADEGLVFEIAFEGLSMSRRHRSGLAMRFPRIARIRHDKKPRDADWIETLLPLISGNPKEKSA